ncbi:MAG: dUTP diphosphatase [Ruminococcus sp.]|nr:dUTP diphosphatase [Ruminococcus sp.]
MTLFFKKLRENAILPMRATPQSAGVDLCACLEDTVEIPPGGTVRIPTGLAVQPSKEDVALLIYPRSGLASKYGITLANAVGVVDSDYRGEIQVPLHNLSTIPFMVENGMRIAQLVVTPVLFADVEQVNELDETQRGSGGFGSSGMINE